MRFLCALEAQRSKFSAYVQIKKKFLRVKINVMDIARPQFRCVGVEAGTQFLKAPKQSAANTEFKTLSNFESSSAPQSYTFRSSRATLKLASPPTKTKSFCRVCLHPRHTEDLCPTYRCVLCGSYGHAERNCIAGADRSIKKGR